MSAELPLRDVDALKLAELLEFLRDLLAAEAHTIAPALERFAGGYPLGELRADLARFAFFLGGDPTVFIKGDQR